MRFRQIAGIVCLGMLAASARPADAQLWRHFLPTSKNAKNPEAAREADMQALRAARSGSIEQHSSAANGSVAEGAAPLGGDLALTQNNGPWLVVAATFSGPGAEKQARDLADELRAKNRLATYMHEMDFKFGDSNPGRGLDNYGAPTRRQFRRGNGAREIAVMVGDFTSIDDPNAQQMLNQIKTLQPNALNVDPNESSQTMAQVRHFEDLYKENFGKGSKRRGPMAQAFLTRNPLLPPEYFVPKGVDPFVAKMNEGVEHSLLDCPGRQTIRVATFRGKTILQTSATPTQDSKSFWGGKKKEDTNPLVEAAQNAHLLAKELRDHGWEAYEFHDRMESIVTIGSFTDVTQRLPDGRVVVIPDVQKIIQTFDAGFDTPADPLSGIGNDSTNQRLVDQEEQQLSMQLSNKQGHVVAGMNPKHVKILRGRGKTLKVDRIIPIDVHPEAIDVPKRSVSSAYAG